jgi:hypothetical protein
VGVDLLRDALVGVPQPVGDDLAVDAEIAGKGGVGVAHIVQPDPPHSGLVDKSVEPAGDRVRV